MIKKILTVILLTAILSSGILLDGVTMREYNSHIIQCNIDMDNYDPVHDKLVEKQMLYDKAVDNYGDAYDSYINSIIMGSKIEMANANNGLVYSEKELDTATVELQNGRTEYELAVTPIYNNLDKFELFVLSNEVALEHNNVDTVFIKTFISDWKEEIEYNYKQVD
ncbi:hypothetical protein HNV12_23550 [Methanococcoides sp. SA1]|nr:hypothetical protein [Methanococcoides sp. SA1]